MLISLSLFTFSAIALYLSSRSLIKNLMGFLYRLTRSQEAALNIIFFLLLPGVFLHEFAHILSAEILQVRTGELSLKPHFKDGHLKLGSAQIAITDPIRLTMIGTAPFLLGTITLWSLLTFGFNLNLSNINLSTLVNLPSLPIFLSFLFAYLIFAISNTMFSSPSDLQAAGLPIILVLIITGAFHLTNLSLPQNIITYLSGFFTLLTTIFLLVLFLNILILVPLRFLNQRLN